MMGRGARRYPGVRRGWPWRSGNVGVADRHGSGELVVPRVGRDEAAVCDVVAMRVAGVDGGAVGGYPRPGMAAALPMVTANSAPTSPAAAAVDRVRWWLLDEVGWWNVVLVMRDSLVRWPGVRPAEPPRSRSDSSSTWGGSLVLGTCRADRLRAVQLGDALLVPLRCSSGATRDGQANPRRGPRAAPPARWSTLASRQGLEPRLNLAEELRRAAAGTRVESCSSSAGAPPATWAQTELERRAFHLRGRRHCNTAVNARRPPDRRGSSLRKAPGVMPACLRK